MRLIDADALKEKACKDCSVCELTQGGNKIFDKAQAVCSEIERIDSMPTIDADPVKHGTWLPHKITASVICSNCRRVFPDETPRCPNCGARMDGDAE